MITSKEYSSKLDELKELNYTNRPIIPEKEPVFNVYLNTRRIVPPQDFSVLAVKGEHLAETIWFTLDRYFDGQDLAQPRKKWAVQYINALGEENLAPITYKYVGDQNIGGKTDSYEDDIAPTDKDSTLKLGWDIHYDLTKEAGYVTIALRCFESNDGVDELTYNLETEPISLRIVKGLHITDQNNENIMNPPRDLLSHLVEKIDDLYSNNTLTGLDYNQINEITLPRIDNVMIKGNVSSEKFTNIDYNKLQNKPSIKVDGVDYIIGGEVPIEVTKIDVDNALKDSENPVQNKVINNRIKSIDEEIQKLWTEVGDMTYIPLKINEFTNNVNYMEKNHLLTGPITFNWEVEGNVANQEIKYVEGGTILSIEDVEARTFSHNFGTFTNDATFTLTVKDKKDNPTMANTQIIFTYKVFYGAAVAPDGDYTSDFITNLEGSSLQETKETTFTIDRAENEYIYFALPQSYGTPVFSVGGFEGGFGNSPIKTITYNETNYDIWRSDNMITATNREIKVV